MDDLLNLFIEASYSEKGHSQNTIQSYKCDLISLKEISKKELDNITSEDIRNYIKFLNKKSFKPKTIARKISSIKQFYKFLLSENYIKHDPTNLIEIPKIPSILPIVLSTEEIKLLIESIRQDSSVQAVRALAMIELLYASGMRISELINIPITSIQYDQNQQIKPYLIIIGKGRKERLVPISKQALESLSQYLSIRNTFIKNKKHKYWLFPSSSKEGNITRQRFGQILKEIAVKANLDPIKISPHILRHSFASHLLTNGADLRVIQELLGHSNINTTQIYTHLETNKLHNIVKTCHPLSKKFC